MAAGDPTRLLDGPYPVLIDEWQQLPQVWDLVRRAVDDGAAPGSFLLTGSALPDPPPTHSGAGRIVTVRMRPLTFSERYAAASVSLSDLLTGSRPPLHGSTAVDLETYADEIVRSGLPAARAFTGRAHRSVLQGYVDRIVDRDLRDEVGVTIRNPAALRRWMTAYAAASSTTASFEAVRDAASAGQADKPSRSSTSAYRDALTRLWLLDDVPAWLPSHNRLRELGAAPKHQLADPALAAQLLGVQASTLLAGDAPWPAAPRDGPLLGALFESLVTLSVRTYAANAEARVGHLRTQRGRREIDLIVERGDGRILAIEVKLSRTVSTDELRHLAWLQDELGDQVLDRLVVTTGPDAYRREDGIAVAPLALLGP